MLITNLQKKLGALPSPQSYGHFLVNFSYFLEKMFYIYNYYIINILIITYIDIHTNILTEFTILWSSCGHFLAISAIL